MNDIRDDLRAIRQAQYEETWEWEATVFLVVCIISIVGWLCIR